MLTPEPTRLTSEQRAAIRARLDAARAWTWHVVDIFDSEGPYVHRVPRIHDENNYAIAGHLTGVWGPEYEDEEGQRQIDDNCEFIGHAGQDISALLAVADALAEAERARDGAIDLLGQATVLLAWREGELTREQARKTLIPDIRGLADAQSELEKLTRAAVRVGLARTALAEPAPEGQG